MKALIMIFPIIFFVLVWLGLMVTRKRREYVMTNSLKISGYICVLGVCFFIFLDALSMEADSRDVILLILGVALLHCDRKFSKLREEIEELRKQQGV